MAENKAERTVRRLLDMIVEEISLVDRAANQHRFLIVKRSDSMDDDTATTESTETPQDTETTVPDTDETAADTDARSDDGGDEGVETQAPDGDPSTRAIATQALETLTEAVEALGSGSDEDAQARGAELARALHEVATRLGGAQSTGETPATPAADSGSDLGSVIASVRSTLERVGQMIAQSQTDATPGESKKSETDTPPVEAKKPQEPQADGASGAVAAKLDRVVGELQAVGETVKAQQKRLARMEKRFGLPNSAPVEKRPLSRTEDDADIGWPLDLNHSLDRDSVDKAISFHDV